MVHLQLIFFGTFLKIFILHTARADISGCQFYETVNISSSQRLPNGSYVYQGLEVPAALTAEYNYIRTELGKNKTVMSHLRGCVCQLKPCIWICCRFKDMQSNGDCTDGLMTELARIKPVLNVTLRNGSVVRSNLLSDFIVVRDQMWMFETWRDDKYILFENGSVLLGSLTNQTMKLRGYDCLHPNQFSSVKTETFVAAFHGDAYFLYLPGSNEIICLSEVFLILTIAVYLWVRELRNLHGKCFICYLSVTCVVFIYGILIEYTIPQHLCILIGYSYTFFWTAKFTWLLSLSHQMWRGLTSINRSEFQHSFSTYSTFAWGLAAILTGVMFLIDYIWGCDPNMVEWIPGVGWDGCDLKGGWSYYAYNDGPFSLLVALNTTLFIMTIISIIRTKLLLNNFIDYDERERNHSSRMQTYMMLLRLSIIMDLQWSINIIADIMFYCEYSETLLKICTYCDLCNGVIIFVLFILKRSTIRLLIDHHSNSPKLKE